MDSCNWELCYKMDSMDTGKSRTLGRCVDGKA